MNEIEILTLQTENAYGWMKKLTESIPEEKWNENPEILESNVSWHIGHQLISLYFHSILVIRGHQTDILETIPLKEYSELFTFKIPPKDTIGKKKPEELIADLNIVEKKSIEIIKSLSPEELKNKLEPARVEHPVARNKFEALDWNIKHTMWHCGQLAILKRVVNERYDFGLKTSE